MSGSYLLDTNVIIYAINQRLMVPAGYYGISIITAMELLSSFSGLTVQEKRQIISLYRELELFEISDSIKQLATEIRKKAAMKLADSIISATAVRQEFVLVTNDAILAEHHSGTVMSLEELMK